MMTQMRIARMLLVSTICLLSFWAKAARDCKAEASVGNFRFTRGELSAEFKVRNVTGCGANPSSTGKLRYSLRVIDGKGQEEVLKNYEAQWIDRAGSAFEFSPRTETFKADKVSEIKQVIDASVFQCGCTN